MVGENRSGRSEPMPGIVRGELGASALLPPKPTHQQLQSTRRGEAATKANHHTHDFEKSVWPLFLDGVTPTGQWHAATPRVGCKSVMELQSL
jgi:hypothetical protein